jgi:hypothetical protein
MYPPPTPAAVRSVTNGERKEIVEKEEEYLGPVAQKI